MDDNTLIKWLNWFYTLEISQVDLYLSQAKENKDDYIAHVLLKVAETEAGHAKSFNDIILRMGCRPYKIDTLVSYITGRVPGIVTPLTGTVNMFLYNYTLESIAIADYKKLLGKLKPRTKLHQEIINILINNLIEEDFHCIWFKEHRESLKNKKN